ncbi:TIGR02757 family protein [Corallococcus llansteffanensis]|uniref:TIGR02757 family protein n=1 Tax=Corallococcus llansteffanensis TaxID=2316731 RepID=A0A3A8PYA0_9BACT|nr:TIGR02757 family protein [Corallococcus llansteffanensis]RKH58745.1 TIGR02757 family protein [Corallococcus llansteffanensis]
MKKRRGAHTGLSTQAAERLRPRLEAFMAATDARARIGFDPVEFPHRYRDPRDVEVSALLAAALAYGRADLFRPKVHGLLARMGPSPAAFVRALDVAGARELLTGFVYRFNVGTDLAVLLLGMGRALREHGSLEALFVQGWKASGALHGALAAFTAALRDIPMAALREALGPERGLHHLLPSPLGPGAAKRLNLYLRWMVRGPDAVDFGIWKQVPASVLLVPLDTHIGRMALHLGLTRRTDLTWRTAEEVTASLRALDPMDPVRYDFALCHYGMSGACPAKTLPEHCARCSLLSSCKVGPRVVARAALQI